MKRGDWDAGMLGCWDAGGWGTGGLGDLYWGWLFYAIMSCCVLFKVSLCLVLMFVFRWYGN